MIVVPHASDLTRSVTLVDTPDLDGDQPLHHAQADRAFRWADAVLMLVTPEKYQMTELVPYYRLGRRYAAPMLFAMNKVEQQAVVDDYQMRLSQAGTDPSGRPMVFAIPRDDANYEPPPQANLDALRIGHRDGAKSGASELRDQGVAASQRRPGRSVARPDSFAARGRSESGRRRDRDAARAWKRRRPTST